MSEKYPYWQCCDTIDRMSQEDYKTKSFTRKEIQAIELYKRYYFMYVKANGEKFTQSIDAKSPVPKYAAKAKQEVKRLEEEIEFLSRKLAYLETSEEIQSVLLKADTPRNIIETTFADEYFGKTEEETNERCEKVDKPIVNEQDNNLSKKEFNQTIFWKIAIPVILMTLLLLSILDLEYGYYQFLRIAVFVGSIAHGFICAFTCRNLSYILVPIAVMAIVWNPISPLYLAKETWVICDIVGAIAEAVIFVLSFIFNIPENNE